MDNKVISSLGVLFEQMVENYQTPNMTWKNIDLSKQAFEMMKSLPDIVQGEFESPAEKASILGNMLACMDEYSTPRLCIEIRQYMQALNAEDEDNNEALEQLHDFINPTISVEEYCRKYSKFLKFDPVERTEAWERVIYEVESECAKLLKDEIQGMGFCFSYWSTKRSVLEKYGISWKTPSQMNPKVMFD